MAARHFLDSKKWPLHVAAAEGRSDIVSDLLKHGAKATDSTKTNGITALYCAARNGDEATIKLECLYIANYIYLRSVSAETHGDENQALLTKNSLG